MRTDEILTQGVPEYAPATMWFTSGNISKQEMTRQLEGFHAQGLRDFFIHPSIGTQGDYLGPHHFDMICHATAEAERLGMNFWIYDEYRWPSGVAAGQVLKKAPWANCTVLSRKCCTAAPGETAVVELPEKARWNTQVLLCVADGQTLPQPAEDTKICWLNNTHREASLEVYYTSWTLRKLDCTSGSPVAENVEGYLDTLDEEAVRVFIEQTHEAYKKHVGYAFGKHLKGIFTDEAAMFPLPKGETREELPWSRRFEEKFLARNGYAIGPRVKELMDRTDPKLTVDYWETATELFMQAYMDQIRDWCEENNLIFTGHLLCEENIDITVMYSGDAYEHYKRFHMPGIDSILTFYFIDDYNFNIAAKRASSANRFLHKERLLSETFTISGWEIRLRDMKRIIHRLALLGVNFLQYMGSAYDFQPAYSTGAMTNNWQNPLFRHYGELSKYVSSLQYLVSHSETVPGTLLFYPMTTARVLAPNAPETNWGSRMNDTLNGLTNSLLGLQEPFEFLFEQLLEEAQIVPGGLLLDGSRFDRIILPCTRYLKTSSFQKLRQFALAGGKLLAINGKPEWLIGETVEPAGELPGLTAWECDDFETVGEGGQGNSGIRTPMAGFTQALKEALGKTDPPIRFIPQDGLLSVIRKGENGLFALLVNDTSRVLKAEGIADKPLRALCVESGLSKPVAVTDGHFCLELEPYECVVLEPTAAWPAVSAVEPPEEKPLALENIRLCPQGDNTALPQMWQVRGSAMEAILQARSIHDPRAVCEIAEKLQEDDLVKCWSEPNRFLAKRSKREWFGWTPVDGKKPGKGETVVCVYDFVMETLPPKLELVSDPQLNTVWYLNYEQLYQTGTKRIWHYANPVFDLTGVAKPGKNRLVAICTYPDYARSFMLPCGVLKGDFRFFPDQILTQKPGENRLDYWNNQGYFCHTGLGSYYGEFILEKPAPVWLRLQTTEVVEVFVNDTFVAKRLWDPYKVELTDFVRPGVNHLELRVTGTLANFLFSNDPTGIAACELYTQ